jgi:hypothetical protein
MSEFPIDPEQRAAQFEALVGHARQSVAEVLAKSEQLRDAAARMSATADQLEAEARRLRAEL